MKRVKRACYRNNGGENDFAIFDASLETDAPTNGDDSTTILTIKVGAGNLEITQVDDMPDTFVIRARGDSEARQLARLLRWAAKSISRLTEFQLGTNGLENAAIRLDDQKD